MERRNFLRTGLLGTAAFTIVPRHVLGGVGFTAPSDQLNLAAIGAGGKGASDIFNASVNGRERVVALCDVDFSGTAAKSVENFPNAKLFFDYREMLEKEKEEMVSMKIVFLLIVFFHVLFVILFFLQRLEDRSQEKEKKYPLL